MSRFDSRDFGEAAQFLRKSDLELMASHTIAFDGRSSKERSKKRNLIRKITLKSNNSVFYSILNSFLFSNKATIQPIM